MNLKLPQARTENIVLQELGKEVLIYDLNTHKAYNLNETASAVYLACDGKTSFDDLKRKHKFTDDLIFLALDQLKEDRLVETNGLFVLPFNGVSRREVIKKVGLTTMIALPVISSLIAPTAAMAASASTCTLGINFGDPNGFGGQGNPCACPTGTAAGSTCGKGTGGLGFQCKTGCTCTAGSGTTAAGTNGTCG